MGDVIPFPVERIVNAKAAARCSAAKIELTEWLDLAVEKLAVIREHIADPSVTHVFAAEMKEYLEDHFAAIHQAHVSFAKVVWGEDNVDDPAAEGDPDADPTVH